MTRVDANPEPNEAPGGLAPPAVHARAIGRAVSGRRILREVSFEIAPASFVSLLGPNGAGKSTLIHIVSSLLPPTEGGLSIFGLDPRHAAPEARAKIGVIGHSTMLYRDLSALENLSFFGSLYGVPDPRERALELLGLVGLLERANDQVKTLSRGMTQRVAIARALMHDPELLLADVPCTRMLSEILLDLHASGKTVVLATHDVGQCLALSQRALVLRAGRLVIDELTGALDEATVVEELMRR